MTGTDSVIDHWSPFGTGDILEKANLYAQLYRGADEYHLSRAMAISTGGVLPLDDKGQRAGRKPATPPSSCWSTPAVPPRRSPACRRAAPPSIRGVWWPAVSKA